MKHIASVIISNATREFDKEYHYIIPESMIDCVVPGIRVVLPFGRSNRSVEGYVIDLLDRTEMKGLKEIKKVLDKKPVLSKSTINLVRWMKERYMCTTWDAIRCTLPPGIGLKSEFSVKLLVNDSNAKGVMKKILEALSLNSGECELEILKKSVNSKSFTKNIKKLVELGFIDVLESYNTGVKEKTVKAAFINQPREEIIDEIESNRIKTIQQIRILEMLLDNEFISVQDIVRFSGVSSGVLDTLKKYGYIDYKDIAVNRDPMKHRVFEKTEPLVPTIQQSVVLKDVIEKMDCGDFGEILLHGVTGSGKTEVYLQLIQHCLTKDMQAIVLVPEISLTPQMVERFKGRFGNDVAVLHSRLSLGERYDQWKLIKDNKIKVAVGARSAVFAPFERLGLIIIDEEHENTYKSEVTPKYHARDVARERCRFSNAILLYGSATPSVETYYKAKNAQINLVEITDRANNMIMPAVELVDMRRELDEGNRSIFSNKLSDEIFKNIEASQQTILFLNRRGFSTFILCRNCGYTLKCRSCNVSMTYHAHEDRLICHYCGYTIKNPETCPMCKSNHIRHFGTGTQRVEENIKKKFSGCTVVRMDMDTTTYKNSHEELLRTFKEENINILVGTQMIAKGHDFPNVTLVGVLAADSLLNTGDYRASERTFQLITQVAGRAGRGKLAGRVVIQTYNTEDFSILAACKHDYISFYNQEIKIREILDYPPYTEIATVIVSGINDRNAEDTSKLVKKNLNESFSEFAGKADILGPARSPLSKIKNKYRWRIIIKCNDKDMLIKALSKVLDSFYNKKGRNAIDISVDINPVNML